MILAVAAALAVLAGPGPTAPTARPRPGVTAQAGAPPVNVDAAQVHYAPRRREVVFTGAPVTMTREDAKLTCARLVAKNDEKGEIVSAVCTGDVRFVRGERVVTCATATYENAQARLTCVGSATLRDGRTEAHGERLTYDLRADETSLEGAPGKPVVNVTIPGEEVEQHRRDYAERRRTRPQKEVSP